MDGIGSTWHNYMEMSVGYNGQGSLEISNGGTVTSTTGYIGRLTQEGSVADYSSKGTAAVVGEGSLLQMNGYLYVGDKGTGTLEITNGGTVKNTNGYLGYASGSNGTATVDGEGSIWQNSASLYVGKEGNGTLNIKNQGAVYVNSSLILSENGTVNLDGGILKTGSLSGAENFNFNYGTLETFDITGDLINKGGILAPGSSPGLLTITGNYTQEGDAFLEIELGGLISGDEYDVLDVTGTLNLAGTLDVIWYDGFTASFGDTFDILDWSLLFGTFDYINLPSLDEGLSWDISSLYEDGSIFVSDGSRVPIPGSIILLGSAILALAGFRKKARSLEI